MSSADSRAIHALYAFVYCGFKFSHLGPPNFPGVGVTCLVFSPQARGRVPALPPLLLGLVSLSERHQPSDSESLQFTLQENACFALTVAPLVLCMHLCTVASSFPTSAHPTFQV